jgi:hypothetical protein
MNAIRERPDRRHATRRRGSSPHADGQERRRADRRVARLRRPLEVDPAAVRTARRVLLLSALIVAPIDLVDKATSSTLPSAYHARGLGGALAMVAMVVIGAWFFPRAGSRLIAVAGGLMVGGGMANVLSLGIWGRGVPNPLLSERLGIAYNLADVAIGLGLLSMMAATLVFALQHRNELSARL